jgi:tetratricopeptide (TPR) repeat protein
MRSHLLIAIFLFICGQNTFAQDVCDTLSSEIKNQFDSYSQKRFNKLSKQKDLDPETAFRIATYLRHKSDTIYKDWYKVSINLFKRTYDGRHDKTSKPCPLFKIGQAFYYLDDYQSASNWFVKAIKAQCPDSCLSYYYKLTMRSSNNDSIPWRSILDTCNFKSIKTVSEIDPVLLEKFPSWKSMSNPNGKFNATDVGGGPRKRLYFAAKCGDYWIISSENGGRGYHTDCFFIKIEPHKTLLISQTYMEFKTLDDLLSAIKKKQYIPVSDWDWREN